MKFVRNSHEFHVNFVQFANKLSKHTSKHTLQSQGHVIDHAPAFEHLGDRHAGAVFARCHSVVGPPTGLAPPRRPSTLLMGTATLCLGGLWKHGIARWGGTR